MSVRATLLVVLALPALSATAAAEGKYVIRMATVAPDGTAWAREFRAFSREVATATRGEVNVKWVLGGIAGSEFEVGERIRRGQLDGTASGGMLCQKVAPSMRVMRVRGVFNDRDEANHVMHRIKHTVDEEFLNHGFIHLGSTGLGPDLVFSRNPIRSLDDLRKAKMWRWDIDEVAIMTDAEMGFGNVPMPLEHAAAAYDEHRIDGFLAIPTAALAFQWFTRARYLLDLRMGFLWGCLIVDRRAFEKLPFEHQQSMRSASAKLVGRFEEVGRQQDDALLGGLFEKQGLKPVPVSDGLRAEFRTASRQARERLGEKLVAGPLLERVLALLADYRSEHMKATR
jgi:TRAP-type transport system periplasmic protein